MFLRRDTLEEEDDLEKVLKKAFLDADKALHTHLSYFNNGGPHIQTHRVQKYYTYCTAHFMSLYLLLANVRDML